MSKLADDISRWLAQQVKATGTAGIVVGVSGGLDSAVVLNLAVNAGVEVLGVMLPCDSSPEETRLAHQVVQAAEAESILVDLTPLWEHFSSILGTESSLAGANLKARLRMATLYFLANERGALVVGTGNRCEVAVGYFTKHGDGGADVLPLAALYKSEVYELARELHVPTAVLERPPSAGLWPGQTDEEEMGITYEVLEEILRRIDAGQSLDGLDPSRVEQVQSMMARSAHKRAPPTVYRPEGRTLA